jgi:hypothetical protein
MAESEGFEPPCPFRDAGFQDRCFSQFSQLSAIRCVFPSIGWLCAFGRRRLSYYPKPGYKLYTRGHELGLFYDSDLRAMSL